MILGFCEHFDIAIATCLPPNLQICLTFWPIHSQYLLRFSHTADVFKHMFLLQTYVQVSENNFFWVHLSDFSTKSIESTREKNRWSIFKAIIDYIFSSISLFRLFFSLSFFPFVFCLSLAVGFAVRSDCVHQRLSFKYLRIFEFTVTLHSVYLRLDFYDVQ